MEKLITIVIPTYNMEKYLDKCLTSLIVPSEYMELIEVLVVNDGSNDNSSAIAHRYEDKYPQTFRVIDKENGNYGSCVNRGLKEATGKYIKILDADDTFDNENWQTLLSEIKGIDADLIITDFDIVFENSPVVEHWNYNTPSRSLIHFSDIGNLNLQMHAVTYRTSLLKDMDYHQTEGVSYTDTEWIIKPMMKVHTVFYIPICVYLYLMGRIGQTVSKEVIVKRYPERLRVINGLLDFCASNQLFDKEESSYFMEKLLGTYKETYNRVLIDKDLFNVDLICIDQFLKEKSKIIYDEIGKMFISDIPFVQIWRSNNYRIPMLKYVLIRMIRLKQKLFPNLKLKRIRQ